MKIAMGIIALGIVPAFGVASLRQEEHHGAKGQARPDWPISQMNLYLDGFHFYADDMGRQLEAHHYCSAIDNGVHQCVIYDGNGPKAKLIGIEYIVDETTFKQFPEEEKKFWHSHRYEIKSGALILPGLPAKDEHDAFKGLLSTYGKTWHTWQVDKHAKFPFGIPQLMMAFTDKGQLAETLVQERDARFKISTAEKVKEREDLPSPEIAPGADSWVSGRTLQLETKTVRVENFRKKEAK